jgi:transcriptional regulator with XRE-family HTH domain
VVPVADTGDIREFLMSRRARLTPAQAGITEYGRGRRVQGLKREEVAILAGISNEYYARLERGNLRGVSESVLNALARALQLDEAERIHLFDLARAAAPPSSGAPTGRPAGRSRTDVRPSIRRLLDSMTETPAYIRNARMDILAANKLCFALYAGVLTPETLPMNIARFVFLDPRAPDFFVQWDSIADDFTSALRIQAGKSPQDAALNQLVGELATNSTAFSTRWARHDVRLHQTSMKRLHNALIGEIELTGDALELTGDGLTLIAYTAEPASQAQQQLDLLASWHADAEHTTADLHDAPTPAQARSEDR